jgi:DNA mismatch endonuclease (patch repair protein)
MADIVDPQTRSRMMAGIRGKNTKPEILIRGLLHRRGFRYRLHANNLPGKPDLSFQGRKAVIFVHGCFWHGHDCPLFKWPSSRQKFWHEKITRNRDNDARHRKSLVSDGWRILTVWECAIKHGTKEDHEKIGDRITKWLSNGTRSAEIRRKS